MKNTRWKKEKKRRLALLALVLFFSRASLLRCEIQDGVANRVKERERDEVVSQEASKCRRTGKTSVYIGKRDG